MELEVILFNKCNFECRHCILSCTPTSPEILNSNDKTVLFDTFKNYSFSNINFAGGEPTIDLSLMNEIKILIDKTKNKETEFGLITNGWFSTSEEKIDQIFNQIDWIKWVSISVDKYHAEFIDSKKLKLLIDYCKSKGMPTSMVARIETPIDILDIKSLEKLFNHKIKYQYVFPFGRAKVNKIGFRDEVFTEKSELESRCCPLIDKFIYIPQKGFTSCCGNLLANSEKYDHFVYMPSLGEYIESDFYKFLNQENFVNPKILSELTKIKYPIRTIAICSYCEYYFKKKFCPGESHD